MAYTMEKTIIVVAGGTGSRMGKETPKQFLELNGKAILQHTIDNLYGICPEAHYIVALPAPFIAEWGVRLNGSHPAMHITIVEGGPERSLSVLNALRVAGNKGIVAVHDGVRPFVTKELMDKLFGLAADKRSAIPVLPMKDSIREVTAGPNTIAADRNRFVTVQTPQCFLLDRFQAAYKNLQGVNMTDDASVFEAAGNAIHTCTGDPRNIKITTPEDLLFAAILAEKKSI